MLVSQMESCIKMCLDNFLTQINSQRFFVCSNLLIANQDVLHPDSGSTKVFSHVNPWNFTARMMIVNPFHLLELLSTPYDVVHVVMPANISCMWLLAAFKIYRCCMVRLMYVCILL